MDRRFARIAAASALALAATLPAHPASAGISLTITVDPVDPRPGDNTLVSGDVSGDCALPRTFEITLTYTGVDSPPAETEVVTGVANPDGTFEDTVGIPEDAVAGEPASVSAEVLCGTVTHTSNTVALTIDAHEGESPSPRTRSRLARR